MADYSFLFEKTKEQPFIERCASACLVLADTIVNDGAASAAEKMWAKETFGNPLTAGKQALAIVIGAHSATSEAGIDAATDAQIQTAVDAAKAVLTNG